MQLMALAPWLYWTLVVLGSLLGLLFVLPAVIGPFLAETYEGEHTLTIAATPEEVWTRLTDGARYPMCRASVRKVDRLPDEGGLPVWREDLGPTLVTVRTVESRPASRLVRESVDSVVRLTMRSEIDLAPDGGGTRVRHFQRTVARRGNWRVPYFRVVLTLSGGAKSAARKYLEDLAKPA